MDLLKRFKSLTKAKIEAFVSDRQEEDVQLEFKTVASPDMTDGRDKKNYARALSGFANSSGGLLVWGVDARKNADGVDCASKHSPIKNVSQFYSKLNEFEGKFVAPVVEGVRHRKFRTTGIEGYVVTYVPESMSGPHMAKGGEHRYYKRSGDSFYMMEHFDIEDMFGRRKKPRLELVTELRPGTKFPTPPSRECRIYVSLKNSGRGVAKYCDFHMRVNSPYTISRVGEGILRPVDRKTLTHCWFRADADIVIHPQSTVPVTQLVVKVPESAPLGIPDLTIGYSIYAEDMRAIEDTRVVPAAEIIATALPQDAI